MVTLAQTKLTRELHRNVRIVSSWLITANTKEAVTLVAKIEVTLYFHWVVVDDFI